MVQIFYIVSTVTFAWQFLPEFAFPMVAALAPLCWFAPNSHKINFLGSGKGGIGLLNITLNWSNITSTVITYPYRSVVHCPEISHNHHAQRVLAQDLLITGKETIHRRPLGQASLTASGIPEISFTDTILLNSVQLVIFVAFAITVSQQHIRFQGSAG